MTVVPTYYPFQVGSMRCVALSDGGLNYPVENIFAVEDAHEVTRALTARGLPPDHVRTPYPCLYIDTGSHRVMVDLGAGDVAGHAAEIFPDLDHTSSVTGLLPRSLAAAQIPREEVDVVIITHAHPDHIGGLSREDGSLLFPRADYFISAEEWQFWTSERALRSGIPLAGETRQKLESIADRVRFVAGEEQIVSGVRALETPGHTVGHLALAIGSGTEELIHISDVALHPLQLEHPDWVSRFDAQPETTVASRQQICRRALERGARIFAHHFAPFPSLGTLAARHNGWRWTPIQPGP